MLILLNKICLSLMNTNRSTNAQMPLSPPSCHIHQLSSNLIYSSHHLISRSMNSKQLSHELELRSSFDKEFCLSYNSLTNTHPKKEFREPREIKGRGKGGGKDGEYLKRAYASAWAGESGLGLSRRSCIPTRIYR